MKYTAVPRTKIVSMMNIAITGSGNEVNFCFISLSLATIILILHQFLCHHRVVIFHLWQKISPVIVFQWVYLC